MQPHVIGDSAPMHDRHSTSLAFVSNHQAALTDASEFSGNTTCDNHVASEETGDAEKRQTPSRAASKNRERSHEESRYDWWDEISADSVPPDALLDAKTYRRPNPEDNDKPERLDN